MCTRVCDQLGRSWPATFRVAFALAAGLAVGLPSTAVADTSLSSCTAAAFDAAAAAGGTVHFTVDCPNLAFDKTITIASGKTLDLEADGHTVALNGGQRRLFTVTGTLTVRGLTITGGSVTGANGANGAPGTPGVDGSPGASGASGGVGVPGQTGDPGGTATAGGAGRPGGAESLPPAARCSSTPAGTQPSTTSHSRATL